jgi:hypothetical protein
MSWIKMRGSLMTNPKVIAVARALLRDEEFLVWFHGRTRSVIGRHTRRHRCDARAASGRHPRDGRLAAAAVVDGQ